MTTDTQTYASCVGTRDGLGAHAARLPYLQSVGTTRAIVAFRTGVSCTPFVRFGEGSDLSRSATATVAGWHHAVVLPGLSAGKTYSYAASVTDEPDPVEPPVHGQP